MAMLVLLETLSPEQRAVLLLRDVFDYGYGEIAAIVGKSEDNVRQLASRARGARRGTPPAVPELARAARRARAAVLRGGPEGDLAGLEALLAHDVVLTGDGGGKVPALARPLQGRNRVARALMNWVKRADRGSRARRCARSRSTGWPAALLLDGEGRLVGVWELGISGGQIQGDQLGRQPGQARSPRAAGGYERAAPRQRRWPARRATSHPQIRRPVDVEHRAAGQLGLGRGEVEHGGGDLLGRGDAPEGALGSSSLSALAGELGSRPCRSR